MRYEKLNLTQQQTIDAKQIISILWMQTKTEYQPCHEKTCLGVWHKQGCMSTEDGYRLEIVDLEREGIVLHVFVQRKQR